MLTKEVFNMIKLQNAISAAAYLKCAEIVKNQLGGRAGLCLADDILAAIPADDMTALRELLNNFYYVAAQNESWFDIKKSKSNKELIEEFLGSVK